jgi:hypothetical protein
MGMSDVEATDIEGPDLNQLESAAKHLDSARKNLQDSVAAARQMMEVIPHGGSKDFEVLVKLRLRATARNTENLEKAVSAVRDHLVAGSYPRSAACLHVLKALDDLFATMKINAQTHQEEGF